MVRAWVSSDAALALVRTRWVFTVGEAAQRLGVGRGVLQAQALADAGGLLLWDLLHLRGRLRRRWRRVDFGPRDAAPDPAAWRGRAPEEIAAEALARYREAVETVEALNDAAREQTAALLSEGRAPAVMELGQRQLAAHRLVSALPWVTGRVGSPRGRPLVRLRILPVEQPDHARVTE